jgi:hypothetical protein
MIKEKVPINSSLQLRSQYSQDVAECKLMFEKCTGFHPIPPDFAWVESLHTQYRPDKRTKAVSG